MTEAYLHRIGLASAEVSLEGLRALMDAHLRAVPFENLDVYYRRGVPLDGPIAVTKVTEGHRGGWCFELNSAFALLLESLGFTVERLAASVLLGDEEPPTPDHLTLVVHLDRDWLVDVGFGDSFTVPLPVPRAEGEPTVGNGRPRPHRVIRTGEHLVLEALREGRWQQQFRTVTRNVSLDHFAPASERLQNTPGLHWTETRFATRLTPTGRVTLLHDRLKLDEGGHITEVEVTETEWNEVLTRVFRIAPQPPVDRREPPDTAARRRDLVALLSRLAE